LDCELHLPNASYFAFTATPKNKTLEVFGDSYREADQVKHRPFDSYTMKQAIQEGFILDVLKNYTPINTYYRLTKTAEDDPEFDVKKAQKNLRRYVEGHEHAIRMKAEIMVDHFHDQVLTKQKIGGQARAMIVTGSIERALQYFFAFREYLKERKSPYQAIVAFSGKPEYKGQKVTESSLNGFASNVITDRIQEDPYRFLICADKFQTGYDEPLLHTMYVDKPLSGIKAVQTLSRLNRAHPKKHDTFVLDFQNDADTIQASFEPYYRTTILGEETNPNKLHDLKADLDGFQVYGDAHVDQLVKLYVEGADRDRLDPILDACVATYADNLDEDGQVDFKGKAKAFVRTYGLHAVPLRTGCAWGEAVTIQYVPSASALVQLLRTRRAMESRPVDDFWTSHTNAIVAYSARGHPPLTFFREEAKAVHDSLSGQVYVGDDSTPSYLMVALPLARYIHFACHAVFDKRSPLDSALLLAPFDVSNYAIERATVNAGDSDIALLLRQSDGRLRLGDIFRELELPFGPVVVLSACDTALARLEQIDEEYFGFPAGFLYAGAHAVISTLWRVDDVATWLLMSAMARELGAGQDPSRALRIAQQELRGLSKADVVQAIRNVAEQESVVRRRARMLEVCQRLQCGAELPFAGPYWWAGFTANGLI